jgi:hypothetical protein
VEITEKVSLFHLPQISLTMELSLQSSSVV